MLKQPAKENQYQSIPRKTPSIERRHVSTIIDS